MLAFQSKNKKKKKKKKSKALKNQEQKKVVAATKKASRFSEIDVDENIEIEYVEPD